MRRDFENCKIRDALCQGVKSHRLCDTCARCVPGPRTGAHLLETPARNLEKCNLYRRKP
jgi:hypothetical protein